MQTPRRPDKRIYWLIALGGCFFIIGMLNLLDRVRWNDPTDGIVWVEQDNGVVVLRVSAPDTPVQVQPGDLLLKIGSAEILNIGDYTDALYAQESGTRVAYLLRDMVTLETKRVLVPITTRPILTIKDFFRVMVALVYFFVGLTVLLRYWQARGSVHFFLVCLFSFTLYQFSYTNNLSLLDYVVYWFSVTSLLFLPPIFLHFTLNFPIPKRLFRGRPMLMSMLYTPASVLAVTQVMWFAGRLGGIGLPRDLAGRIFLDNLHIIYFTVYFLAAVGVLIHSRLSLEVAELRQQMKWIVSGTVLSLVPFCFLYVLPFVLNLEITPLMQASLLSLAFLPLSFAYAIMKYRLMDVDIIFKRGASYLIASAAVLGLYFLFIGLISMLLRFFYHGSDTLAVAVSALVVAFLFAPIRRRIQEEIDRIFYKDEYKYRQSLIEFGRSLGTESSLDTLTGTIIDRLTRSLRLRVVAILLKTEEAGDSYRLLAQRGLPVNPPPEPVMHIPEAFLIRGGHVPTLSLRIFGDENGERLYVLKEQYEQQGLVYFQPLTHRGRSIGVIALGCGEAGAFLSSEDLELLHVLAGYAAIALENARLYSSLQGQTAELAQLKSYNDHVIAGIRMGLVAVDPQGVVTTWNHAMRGLTGVSPTQAVGRPMEELLPADVYASLLRALDSTFLMAQRPVQIYKLNMGSHSGEPRFVNLSISPLRDSEGRGIGTLAVFDEITARVQLERQLLQAEKLSSLGLIAAGVAHEVNTPLTGISSFTQMLMRAIPPPHPHHDILQKIERQCDRASNIVSNLLNFARIQPAEMAPVDLNAVLGEALSLLEHQFHQKNAVLRRRLATDLPSVRGNAGRLIQVFVNILLNARDAIAEGGVIEVSTEQVASQVVVQILDNGQGMPDDIVHRIYDPFFTTKEIGRGTGLGLSVSYGIIQEHAGRIFVDSRPGQGTRFIIKLPVEAGANPEDTTHERPAIRSGWADSAH